MSLIAGYELCTRTDFFFFFQAEDGIRDIGVTGVQTCALPIWATPRKRPVIVPDVFAASPFDAPNRLIGWGTFRIPWEVTEIRRASCREREKSEVVEEAAKR